MTEPEHEEQVNRLERNLISDKPKGFQKGIFFFRTHLVFERIQATKMAGIDKGNTQKNMKDK